jgi:hypothetical protein
MTTPPAGRPPSPWRSAPLLWFVVGLPATVVAAGFVTLAIAVRSSDDVVRDDFRKEGLAIYADPTRDAAAASLGARARLSHDAPAGTLRVELVLERGEPPGSLLVVLSHATRAEFDRMVSLRGDGHLFEGRIEPLPPGRWFVEITPPDRQWRLKGDFRDATGEVALAAPGVS